MIRNTITTKLRWMIYLTNTPIREWLLLEIILLRTLAVCKRGKGLMIRYQESEEG